MIAIAVLISWILLTLVMVNLARKARDKCIWSHNQVAKRIWLAVAGIAVGVGLPVLGSAQPWSVAAILSDMLFLYSVFILSKAAYRRRDLAKGNLKKDLAKAVSSDDKTIKLNGWQRMGIVASAVWIFGAGIYTFKTAEDADIKFATQITESCIEAHNGQEVGDNECLRRGEDYAMKMLPSERIEAALVAFVPVPLGWAFIYLVLFLVRWIRRGFMPPETPMHGS